MHTLMPGVEAVAMSCSQGKLHEEKVNKFPLSPGVDLHYLLWRVYEHDFYDYDNTNLESLSIQVQPEPPASNQGSYSFTKICNSSR